MMNFFQIMDAVDDACSSLGPVIKVVKFGFMPIIQIGIPMLLIVLGSIDLGKAVIASDDKEVKQATSRLIKRCIYAVAIFFVVTIVNLLLNLVGDMQDPKTGNIDPGSWWACWSKVSEEK